MDQSHAHITRRNCHMTSPGAARCESGIRRPRRRCPAGRCLVGLASTDAFRASYRTSNIYCLCVTLEGCTAQQATVHTHYLRLSASRAASYHSGGDCRHFTLLASNPACDNSACMHDICRAGALNFAACGRAFGPWQSSSSAAASCRTHAPL